jgi:hypothetical protein
MLALLGALGAGLLGSDSAALAQDVTIELDQVTAAIKGQDVTIHARVSQEVDEAKLFIRKLLELGPFNDLSMEKTGSFTYRYVLPLSQEQGEVGRLEYYVAAYRGGQEVAKTESNVISFIDPPFIGDLTASPTEGLEREDWKLFIKGRISRPFYKRWWVWALLGAAGVGATAVLVRGEEAVPEVDIDFELGEVERSNIQTLCPRLPVPVTLTLTGGAPPFQAILLASNEGINTIQGIGPRGSNAVFGFLSDIPEGQGGQTVVEFSYPGFSVPLTSANAQNPVILRAIVRDSKARAFSVTPAVGSPLPATIEEDDEADSRIRAAFIFENLQTNDGAVALGCPAP